ncbi:MAG: polyphosphate polymerase domain-containing protein [Bacteroidales bacterium]|nr:polyphosphate polymerase domain-containing protein [Bacteroidales bacterium]
MKPLDDILNVMEPISLDDMSAVKMMNRIDTKYVADDLTVNKLFELIKDEYYVQEIDGKRISAYDSVYYDTADNHMYIIHQDKKLKRDKLRVRNYVDTGTYFCEVKHKNNHGRTKKKRIEVGEGVFADLKSDAATREFVENQLPTYDFDGFVKKLSTAFERVTVVNKGKTERITIDFNVRFHNFENGNECGIAPLVIIELKRDGQCESFFQKTLFDLRVKPLSISKYCIGRALTDKTLKQNRFKKKIIKLEKLKKLREYAITSNDAAGV